jgi:hypothetical protein
MPWRFVFAVLIAAALHLLLTFGAVMVSFSYGMARFENPELEPSLAEQVFAVLAAVLPQPLLVVRRVLPLSLASSLLEWLGLTLNSLLWGFVLVSLWYSLRRFRQKF